MELGNFFHQPGPFAEKINKYMRDALESNPVAVFNLASEDLNLVGKLDFGGLENTDTVSANLQPPAGSGYEHLKRWSVQEVELPNGWPVRIGIIGIADPKMVKPNSGLTARDPLAAVAEVLPEMKGKADFVLVIGEMTDQTADAIAGEFPEIYGVLRSERTMRMAKPRQVNNALIMSSVERGRMLGQMTLVLTADKKVASYTYKYIDLNQGVKDDPALAARASEVLK